MNNIDIIFERAKVLYELDKELREAEDDFLETWLMEGLPDGYTLGELVDYCEDDEAYDEFIELAFALIAERGIEDYYECMD